MVKSSSAVDTQPTLSLPLNQLHCPSLMDHTSSKISITVLQLCNTVQYDGPSAAVAKSLFQKALSVVAPSCHQRSPAYVHSQLKKSPPVLLCPCDMRMHGSINCFCSQPCCLRCSLDHPCVSTSGSRWHQI